VVDEDKPGIGTALLAVVSTAGAVGTAMYLLGRAHGVKRTGSSSDARPVKAFTVLWSDRTGPKAGKVKIRYHEGTGEIVRRILKRQTPDRYTAKAVAGSLRAIGAEFADHRDGSPGYFGVYQHTIDDPKLSEGFTTIDGEMFKVFFYRDLYKTVSNVLAKYAKTGYTHQTINDLLQLGAEVVPSAVVAEAASLPRT